MKSSETSRIPKTIFVKLSGELLSGKGHAESVDHEAVYAYAKAIRDLVESGLRLGVAVGGGNIYRGRRHREILNLRTSPYAGDHMGLLATVINGIALKDVLVQQCGVRAQLFSEVVDPEIAERFLIRKCPDYWRDYQVLIFTGTGAPAVGRSSDSVAADCAVQIEADLLIKATKVDGVFDQDPEKFPQAHRFSSLPYERVLALGSSVMDREAIMRCRDFALPIRVLRLPPEEASRLSDGACLGEGPGTIIHS